jgi:hypothetical protein
MRSAATAARPAPPTARLSPLAWEVTAWLALAVCLVVLVPLFLRMAVWGDCTLFDLAARKILADGYFVRDMFAHGPPGMAWFQTGVRAVVGWSTPALRATDLVLFAGTAWLLARGTQPPGLPRATSLWLAVVLFLSYTAATEWGHCQPDSWMLLLALGALALRQRQLRALLDPVVPGRVLARNAVLEGVLWGLAFLIKPFVAFAALPCLLLTTAVTLRDCGKPGRGARIAWDAAGVLAGGLLVGAAAVGVLLATGDWPAFLTAMLSDWNQDYYQSSPGLGRRVIDAFSKWLWPWTTLHAVAVPLALFLLVRGWRRATRDGAAGADAARLPLLAAFYLGWFLQANFIQRQFEYHVLSALLLAWAVVLGWVASWRPRLPLAAAVAAAVVWLAAYHPLMQPQRLSLWAACWSAEDPDRLKDRLSSNHTVGRTTWQDLRGVMRYLQQHHAGDREVTCWHFSAIPLYTELRLEPSTRFVFPGQRIADFPSHGKLILAEAMSSPQRYVVIDLASLNVKEEVYRRPMRFAPDSFPPFRPRAIVQSGRYVVLDLGPAAGHDPDPPARGTSHP